MSFALGLVVPSVVWRGSFLKVPNYIAHVLRAYMSTVIEVSMHGYFNKQNFAIVVCRDCYCIGAEDSHCVALF